MFDINSHEARQFFANVWANRFAPHLDALQTRVLEIVLAHPEYHVYLEKIDDYVDYQWLPENGETNPFLHISLHLSLKEQVSIDQPFGIADIYQKLLQKHGGWHEAEHAMMDALVETIWQAQKYGQGLDVNVYMTNLRRLVDLGQEDNARLNPHEV